MAAIELTASHVWGITNEAANAGKSGYSLDALHETLEEVRESGLNATGIVNALRDTIHCTESVEDVFQMRRRHNSYLVAADFDTLQQRPVGLLYAEVIPALGRRSWAGVRLGTWVSSSQIEGTNLAETDVRDFLEGYYLKPVNGTENLEAYRTAPSLWIDRDTTITDMETGVSRTYGHRQDARAIEESSRRMPEQLRGFLLAAVDLYYTQPIDQSW